MQATVTRKQAQAIAALPSDDKDSISVTTLYGPDKSRRPSVKVVIASDPENLRVWIVDEDGEASEQ